MLGRAHVESERSLASVRDFAQAPFEVPGFATGQKTQILSVDEATGESTQRVHLSRGWKAPIGHFDVGLEVFVLSGEIRQGGFRLRRHAYAHVPAGIVVGPWEATEDTVLLFMPDKKPRYHTDDYAGLRPSAMASVSHPRTQQHPDMARYVPAQELDAMQWESTTFLPAGAARKSLYTDSETGRATWVLGLVPRWIEGNFFAGHPTTEEAYMLEGDVKGHWCMQDDPFERRYAPMCKDGYYWRPAHVPHGPFWSESGALLLFRTKDRLDCYWMLHSTDIEQRGPNRD